MLAVPKERCLQEFPSVTLYREKEKSNTTGEILCRKQGTAPMEENKVHPFAQQGRANKTT